MKTLHGTALQAAGVCLLLALLTTNTGAQNAASPLGKTNVSAYLSEAPLTPVTTDEAIRRARGADLRNPDPNALEQFYQPYVDKVQQAQQVYEQYYADRMRGYSSTQNESTLRAQAMAQANQNPIVASMGGAEKVAQMSPQEAEAAARQAAAAYQADPFAANGVQSPGMTALYRKIMSDPAYAEKFQNMSEQEREAELRKFMANDQPVAQTPAQMQQRQHRMQQQTQQSNKVRAAMAFQQEVSALQIKIGEATTRYEQQRAEVLAGPGNHGAIEAAFRKKYDAVPIVELGEYGHDKDPAQMQKLRQEEAAQHQAFAARVLKQDLVLLQTLRTDFQRIIAEYNDYMAVHRSEVNSDLADMLNGTETESMLGGFESGLLGLGLELVARAKICTREAAQW